MQTFITSFNFNKSAQSLDQKRLGSQIYEGIHILASLLNMEKNLVNPKRNVGGHPAAKLWRGFEMELGVYINSHLQEWFNRGYTSEINIKNYHILAERIPLKEFTTPVWITRNLIQVHRSVLIQKNPDFYRNKWGNVPDDLEMKYTWRD